MDELGYKYLVIDDGWQLQELGPKGELVPNPTTFPHGIVPVVQYVRQRGFELGIYSSPNILSCANFAGSLGHETVHVRQFAEWGCKFVKYDYCPVRNGEHGLASDIIIDRYRVFGDALKANAPDILFAICEKGWAGQISQRQRTKDSPPITPEQRRHAFAWCREVGGVLWRTTGDIGPQWTRIMQIVDEQEGLALLSGPNAFNDPDTRGRLILLCTDLTLDALAILRLYGWRFKIEVSFKQSIHTVGTYAYHFWMKDMIPLRRGEGNQYLHRQSDRYRAQVRRKLAAYERHIQIGLIVQGLLQYLAVFHHRAVWRFFGSWLRTENHALAPSELVVAHALRNSLPDFLLSLPYTEALKKFLAPKLAPERCPNMGLIQLDQAA